MARLVDGKPGNTRLVNRTTGGNDALVNSAFFIFKLRIVVWLIGALLGLGLLGTVIYVAVHFLAKVW